MVRKKNYSLDTNKGKAKVDQFDDLFKDDKEEKKRFTVLINKIIHGEKEKITIGGSLCRNTIKF